MKFLCQHCSEENSAVAEHYGQPTKCVGCAAQITVPDSLLDSQVVWGDFVLKKELGSGANGHVFLALQRTLDRLCAVKVLHRELAQTDEQKDSFRQEAKIVARLNHPGIVQCYFADEVYDSFYFAMEYVSSLNLKQVLADGKLTENDAILLAIKVSNALDYAWKKEGLVHCDIKPDNILITDDGQVKLTDLGLALTSYSNSSHGGDYVKGTPFYIPPEQIRGEQLTCRTDIYSLGALLYECLSGRFVFDGDSPEKICYKHLDEPPTPLIEVNPEVSPRLSAVIMKMLEKDPENRYQTFEQLSKLFSSFYNPAKEPQLLEPETAVVSKSVVLGQQKSDHESDDDRVFMSRFLKFVIFVLLVSTGILFANSSSDPGEGEDDVPFAESVIEIKALLPDPIGFDSGKEWIEITNPSSEIISFSGWSFSDAENGSLPLADTILMGGESKRIVIKESFVLNNSGDKISLIAETGQIVDQLSYEESQVSEGQIITSTAK